MQAKPELSFVLCLAGHVGALTLGIPILSSAHVHLPQGAVDAADQKGIWTHLSTGIDIRVVGYMV